MVPQGILSQILTIYNEVDGFQISWCSESWILWLGYYITMHLVKFPAHLKLLEAFETLVSLILGQHGKTHKGKKNG